MLNNFFNQISDKNRNRKWQIFLENFLFDESTKVLDVGYCDIENKESDNYVEKKYPYQDNLTALGIEKSINLKLKYPAVQVIQYDGKIFPFAGKKFDICFSSAVLEHVGNEDKQINFLKEIKRTSKSAFITTPNKYFPLEVHTRLPLLHFLPKKIFNKILHLLKMDWAAGDYMFLLSFDDIKNILARAGISEYKIIKNKFFIFTIDFVIIF